MFSNLSFLNILFLLSIFAFLLAGFIKLCRDFIYILKHFKLFKHFFYQPKKGKSLLQLFIVFILICLFVFEVYGLFFNSFHFCNNTPSNSREYRNAFKKAVSTVNQAMTLNYALEENVQLGSIEEFADLFDKRLHVISSNFNHTQQGNNYKPMKLYDNEISKYNLSKYSKNPMFINTDGMLYMFEKFTPECKFIDEDEPQNSDCIMVVDVNGFKNPNGMTIDRNSPLDRYQIFIDGNKFRAIPLYPEQMAILYDTGAVTSFQGEENGRK